METLWQDLKHAVRVLLKRAGFAAVAVLTLALGIGANAAIFSVVDAVLLRPLPYRDAERIVTLASFGKKSGSIGWVSQPDFQDWHDQSTDFEAMAYYASDETSVTAAGAAEYATGAIVSPEFFRVFSVEPQVGRAFSPEEQKPGSAPVAVISDAFWERNFGRNPSTIGRTLNAENIAFTIIGVMPRGFQFPVPDDFWIPMSVFQSATEKEERSAHNYQAVGLLKSGVSIAAARTQMEAIGARIEQEYPLSNKDLSVAVVQMQNLLVRNVRLTLYLLLGAVTLVLLIACANVANLLLAQATGRTREIAIRAAMGASRWRLVRQLMVESAVLAAVAGAAGLILANWGVAALAGMAPTDVPRVAEVRVDGLVLTFAFGVSLLACVFFGLAPALHASKTDLNEGLKQSGSRAGTSGASARIRSGLLVGEVALSVVLVACAGLLVKSIVEIARVNLGFRPENTLVMETSVGASDVASARRANVFYTQMLERVAALPGVTSVAAANGTPAGGFMSNGGYWIEGGPGPEQLGVTVPQAGFPVVTPGYFQTLGISITRGRDFNEGDKYDAPFVAIISESLARKSFPNADPIGKQLRCGMDPNSFKGMTIVGVAADIRMENPTVPPGPQLYMPYLQHPGKGSAMRILVKTVQNPRTLEATLVGLSREVNPNVPSRFTTMEAMLAGSLATSRFRAALLGVFAGLALCLAIAGVYGVMVYNVTQRTNEIGIRLALGAQRSSILKLVLGHGLRLAALGVGIGMAGALAASRLIASFLYGTKSYDPTTFVAVSATLLLAALAACWIPARRAMRVDPIVALRYE